MKVFAILKNNFNRIIFKKSIVLTVVIIIPLMIISAIYVTSITNENTKIAIVTNNKNLNISNSEVNIERLDKVPEISDLMLDKYDGALVEKEDHTFDILTVKDNETKESLEKLSQSLQNNIEYKIDKKARGMGGNILGFLMIIILREAVSIMVLYPEDRDLGTFRRILSSPVGEKKYLFSYGLFNFTVLYVPVLIAIFITKAVFKVDIGFSYTILALLLLLLTVLGTAFALFMTSAIEDLDNSILLSTILVMLTSIVAGCFYSFSIDNKIIEAIIDILPQKQYLILVDGIEKGGTIINYLPQLIYIIISILVFFVGSQIVTKRKIKLAKY